MTQVLTGNNVKGVQITEEGLTINAKTYSYNSDEGLLGVVIHGEDSSDHPKTILISSAGSIHIVSEDAENTFSIGKDIAVSGSGVLVDLSDSTTYPHTNTGRVDVSNIIISGKSGTDTDVEVGYYDGLTYHTIVHHWIDSANNQRVFYGQSDLGSTPYRCSNMFSKADSIGKSVTGIGRGDIWYDVSATPSSGQIDILVQYHTHENEGDM